MISGIIGVRYARGCHPDDLWTKYFTSSYHVAVQRWLYGEPDVIEVRKVFQTKESAQDWEHRVLRRTNAIKDQRWLNKHDPKGKWFGVEFHSEETKIKLKKPKKDSSMMGRYKRTEEIVKKQNVGNWRSKSWSGDQNPNKTVENRRKQSERMLVDNPSKRDDVKLKKSQNRKNLLPVYDLLDKKTKLIHRDIFYFNRDRFLSTRSKEFKDVKNA